MDKKIARAKGLQARALLSLKERSKKSHAVCQEVISRIHAGMIVGCYVSIKDELNTSEILKYCFANNITVCVPKVVENTLKFYKIKSNHDLVPAPFGLLEPNVTEMIPVQKIDMMIVPLSSYDSKNHRTGYGKGYYDSVLLNCRNRIGVAFQEQEVDQIDIESHDITLDEIISA
ncbi:MAG: 5-formyltetrahydrofolate cyclo-ligase [Solobacterium sp.]|nr:5-formyltetrahydrofolate cyclo-ligase [Solobacterium sp.]